MEQLGRFVAMKHPGRILGAIWLVLMGSTIQMQLDAMLPDDAIVVYLYQPHLSWVERVFNEFIV